MGIALLPVPFSFALSLKAGMLHIMYYTVMD